MSKQPIQWHEECLKNRLSHYARKRETAQRELDECLRADNETAFYAQQIDAAKARGMTAFDRNRLLKANTKISHAPLTHEKQN